MDDADLAGPLLFCFCFGTFLLFVRPQPLTTSPFSFCVQSGKTQFGYIYGVALLGSASIYTLLNLMSEQGIDAYRVASVLGYCLLPMVGVGALSIILPLEYVPAFSSRSPANHPFSGPIGAMLSSLSVMWCTYAASGIFVAVLRMSDQRLLVAYPVALLYGCFAIFSVFRIGGK